MPTLDQADAELAAWRDRLAAASRNVSELTELPEYGAAKAELPGLGRIADEARNLVATVDELWQGVLLIGAALDRAEAARRTGSRLWRGEEAAAEALGLLHDASITVDLSETPVLHRRLLAGPRATVTVSPETLLQTMDAAFDRARERLTRITEARARASSLQDRLRSAAAKLPLSTEWTARLEAAALPDPLDRLAALEKLGPEIDAALAATERARDRIAAARRDLATLHADAAAATAAANATIAAIAATPPPFEAASLTELSNWLERIGTTLEAGRVEASLVGLANWQALFARVRTECSGLAEFSMKATTRHDELAARLGALGAKHRARKSADPALDALAAAAKDSLTHTPTNLDEAARALAAYNAALSGPPSLGGAA